MVLVQTRKMVDLIRLLYTLPIFISVSVWAGGPIPLPDHADDFYAVRPASIDCVVQAVQKQDVPANVLLALASIEQGKNGQFVTNRNGSQDVGHFQINTVHWKPKGFFGGRISVKKKDVAWRGCYNAELAAWLLYQHIRAPSPDDFWTKAANYHSKTKKFNEIYRKKLIHLSIQWGNWLQQKYKHLSISQR